MKKIDQTQRIQNTYDWLDEIFRTSMGPFPDISSALYDKDYNKTLRKAQFDKHSLILKNIKFKPGMRILDIGCGWGPMMNFIKKNGGEVVGLTLSKAQAKYVSSKGHKVMLLDWRDADTKKLGKFDAVVSVEALEHFCNCEQFLAGEQEEIYQKFFKFVNSVLPSKGRVYIQTATWGNPHPKYEDISLNAPKHSPEYIAAHLRKFYDESGWPADSVEQISKQAKGFKLLSKNSMRLDNIETSTQWAKRMNKILITRPWIWIKLIPRLRDRKFRDKLTCLRYGASQNAFRKNVLHVYRIVFEKTS